MPVVETFFGYVETTKDSLLLLEACRQGSLPRVGRRLQDHERELVKSGAVFCFDENESGIKRWTDGLVWSPSRIHGNFLIYRELEDRRNTDGQQQDDDNNTQLITSGLTLLSKRQRERTLAGSSRHRYRFKDNGLIKKSLSVAVNGVHQHLISYYNKDDLLNNRFKTPSDIPELAALEISAELLDGQNFRIPFLLGGDDPNRTTTRFGDKHVERPTKLKKRSTLSRRHNNNFNSEAATPSSSYVPPISYLPFDNQALPEQTEFHSLLDNPGTNRISSQHVSRSSYSFGSDGHHQWVPHSFSSGYSNERYDQNPHQHLFSSSSFHAINHAAIPTRTPELVSNAFMLDINALFGSGWNDFEIQM